MRRSTPFPATPRTPHDIPPKAFAEGLAYHLSARHANALAGAEVAYRQVIALTPGHAEAHNNLGIVLHELKRFTEAEIAFRRAIAVKPEYPDAQWNLSLHLLSRGRFKEAWPLHEARYHTGCTERKAVVPSVPFPQWQGESLAGKSILICPEQGFGDEIQFARYVPLLKAKGASVTLICKPPLRSLLASVPGVDTVLAVAENLAVDHHDFWTFPFSLPLHFHTTLDTIPAALPYLTADPELVEHWRPHLPLSGFRVGLVWKGRSSHKNDAHRSLPELSALAPLWTVPNVSFVSLQKGPGEKDALHPPAGQPLFNLGTEVRNFADTAAIVSQLDLVICVDTAVAHLAGALGKPCWVLLSAIGTDWRWLHDRADSPWYPGTMRLFRQETPNDWADTVAKVVAALEKGIGGRTVAQFTAPTFHNHASPLTRQIALQEVVSLYLASKPAEALAQAESALSSIPGSALLLNVAALSAAALNLHDLAERYWRTAIRVQPGYAEAYSNLGGLLKGRNRLAEAEAVCRQAIALKPKHPDAHNDLGVLFNELNRSKEAEAAYRQAIALKPEYAEAYYNLGVLLYKLKRFGEAEIAFRQAITRRPGHSSARWNLSLILLSFGHFDKGWLLYEARQNPGPKSCCVISPDVPFPQWHGESLAGKSILIWPEQGFGDEIQFARYAPLLKQRGATRVTLACKAPLWALFGTLAGIDAVVDASGPVPGHDFWTFPLSLPLHFHTTLDTIPAALPYLTADPELVEHWRPRLPLSGFRVGLVWKGRSSHKNDAHRSLPELSALAPLWTVPNVSFVSLQKGPGEKDALHPPAGQPLFNLGTEVRNFADTAAIVSQLDLVICVDTAVAHLAGALGKPCWVLLSAIGTDWRWLHDRADSPWYPGTMRLFRQETPNDWADTVAKVSAALEKGIGGRTVLSSALSRAVS